MRIFSSKPYICFKMVAKACVHVYGMIRLNRKAGNPPEVRKKEESGSKRKRECNYIEKLKNILVLYSFYFTTLVLISVSSLFKSDRSQN